MPLILETPHSKHSCGWRLSCLQWKCWEVETGGSTASTHKWNWRMLVMGMWRPLHCWLLIPSTLHPPTNYITNVQNLLWRNMILTPGGWFVSCVAYKHLVFLTVVMLMGGVDSFTGLSFISLHLALVLKTIYQTSFVISTSGQWSPRCFNIKTWFFFKRRCTDLPLKLMMVKITQNCNNHCISFNFGVDHPQMNDKLGRLWLRLAITETRGCSF